MSNATLFVFDYGPTADFPRLLCAVFLFFSVLFFLVVCWLKLFAPLLWLYLLSSFCQLHSIVCLLWVDVCYCSLCLGNIDVK